MFKIYIYKQFLYIYIDVQLIQLSMLTDVNDIFGIDVTYIYMIIHIHMYVFV